MEFDPEWQHFVLEPEFIDWKEMTDHYRVASIKLLPKSDHALSDL
jgi:hypothetical protein